MEKALHGRKEQFLLSSKGRLIGWAAADVKNLISNANIAITEKLKNKNKITIRDAECLFAFEWFESLIDKGITKALVEKLNSRIAHVRYHHVLMHFPKGKPYWRYVANGDQIDDPELSVAYGVSHLLATGALDGLKRCQAKDCQQFFLGRPNAKWCSNSCGSKHRVTKMRKNKLASCSDQFL